MRLIIYFLFLFSFLTTSCQEINYDNVNFSDNDVVVYSLKKSEDFISEVELIIKLDNRAEGVHKVEDFNIIYLNFGFFITDDEYNTKGQQCFIPSENILISNQNRIELLDIEFEQDNYLYLRINIFTLQLITIDGFYVYFHLRDNDRQPILRYNTEPFFFRSEKAKELNLFDDIR